MRAHVADLQCIWDGAEVSERMCGLIDADGFEPGRAAVLDCVLGGPLGLRLGEALVRLSALSARMSGERLVDALVPAWER